MLKDVCSLECSETKRSLYVAETQSLFPAVYARPPGSQGSYSWWDPACTSLTLEGQDFSFMGDTIGFLLLGLAS